MAKDAVVVAEIWFVEHGCFFRPFWLGKFYEVQLTKTHEEVLHFFYREGIFLILTLTKGGSPKS